LLRWQVISSLESMLAGATLSPQGNPSPPISATGMRMM
jgi:hypothetical protein